MAANQSMQNNAQQQEQKGTSEDPPVNLTKQNEAGKEKEGSSEVDVPKEAVENYKQNAADTEE